MENKRNDNPNDKAGVINKGVTNPVSQLSSALKQVNIGSAGSVPNDVRFDINGDTSLMESSQSQSDESQEYSRITSFFQNQPIDGYTLFSHRSAPNGYKVAITLSELNLKYNTIFLDFNKREHRAPEFVAMNPNARVPALIDHCLDNLALWESGAILLHLVNKNWKDTGKPTLWSDDIGEQSQITAWLFFQTSGHAPMIGQALHFKYFHTQKIQSAIDRYTNEVRRVYSVIEMALAERREALIMEFDSENASAYSSGTTQMSQSKFFEYPVWLVGDQITIADICFVPWNNVVDRIGINIKTEFPEVYKWTKHMMRRPAVNKAFRGE
ncbi:similar to Saccharomyces cerevisiae YNL229C URE2 Nitrogen catabolite repression transcriptional regulator that acts by inhibition of GLN3 transcription in good nitrogen source [Maudiozyma saulgeensis]|uniref:Protein URE2 n=1 Tax=Maudiozyma saulgeensis TaxID=1789683 RepID=A0A1X7R2A4_9SACH|nr:similar to Saccharomyces cerevisiae YNL229C URE2 Nitrogen catabolite repression transcriptional regulator that acts by inhibition of GLN3 transcription in good nitrogen source [Kazachstania saulgeensis]